MTSAELLPLRLYAKKAVFHGSESSIFEEQFMDVLKVTEFCHAFSRLFPLPKLVTFGEALSTHPSIELLIIPPPPLFRRY